MMVRAYDDMIVMQYTVTMVMKMVRMIDDGGYDMIVQSSVNALLTSLFTNVFLSRCGTIFFDSAIVQF